MTLPNSFKSFAQMCVGCVIGILLFIGALTVFANYPAPPNGENEGWWLGSVFNLNSSSSHLLSIKSTKVTIPTKIEDLTSNNQVATKEYVDFKTKTAGWESVILNNSTMPTMITLWGQKSYTESLKYCNALVKKGYDDWHMPTYDELSYAFNRIEHSFLNSHYYLWTRSSSWNCDNSTYLYSAEVAHVAFRDNVFLLTSGYKFPALAVCVR